LDPERTISLDTDWFYRKGARLFMWFAEKPVALWEGAVSRLADTAVLPFLHGSARLGMKTDMNVVDACVNGVARTALAWGASLRRLQTGVVTHYAMAMVGGVVAGIAVYFVVSGG
ncbi:MAG: Na+/H+ antiporter subunit D, partial [Alphaproteobacteria bacterium]|nr:Na+/H+ antiporter subunit D [Alphaproteobacteria bacterium]